jgi:glycosyltransferase involved in cell wall biosynthesis
MRILHLDSERGFRGGERQVQLLMEGLAARGHESAIAGPAGAKLLETMAAKGFATLAWKRPMLLGMRSPFLVRWLRQAAADFRADIVHAHTGNAHTLAVGAMLGRLPVVSTRRVDFAIKGNSFSRRKYLAAGQRFIAISSGVRDVLAAGGVAMDRIDIVPSGIDTSRVVGGDGAAIRREFLDDGAGPLIGFVGALVDHKAPWILAEAAPLIRRELPGARIVFVGDGELRPQLEAIAAAYPDAIAMAGWRDNMRDWYAAFDMFAMPSKLEGLCTSLIDALAAGVPCVASRTGGIPDVIVDGETGVLVPPLQVRALADAIVSLWHVAPRRAQFIEAGREHAARFSADAMVEGTIAVYRKLLG